MVLFQGPEVETLWWEPQRGLSLQELNPRRDGARAGEAPRNPEIQRRKHTPACLLASFLPGAPIG